MSYYCKKLVFYLFIFLSLTNVKKSYIKNKLIEPHYNFGNHQNPEIDKLYKHLKGRNIYFVTQEPEKTLYTIIIYPENTLEIGLKMYTDSNIIIEALNKGKKLYFGFDLLMNNMDITLSEYNTDIVICIFDLHDANCYDYAYDIHNKKYINNTNAKITNNNLIPIDFSSVELNLLKENVLEYKNYYCVTFTKTYPELFDNVTMLNFFLFAASQMERKTVGFYGIANSEEELNEISLNKILYYKEIEFVDGAGLEKEFSNYLKNKSNIIFILLFTLILVL